MGWVGQIESNVKTANFCTGMVRVGFTQNTSGSKLLNFYINN